MEGSGTMIDKISPVPAYYQIYQYIVDKVKNGEWKLGSQIPVENDLAEYFDVSRMTLRHALNLLKQEGVIISKPGVGSFVASTRINQSLTSLTGFSEDMIARGYKPSSKVLSTDLIAAEPFVAGKFGISAESQIIRIRRLRFADDIPMSIESAHLVAEDFPELINEDLSHSLYNIFRTHYGVMIKRAEQQLQAGLPSKYDASVLEIEVNEPVMKMSRVTYDQNDKPIEVVSSVYRGDLYVFDVELTVE